ncbi:DUF397 domain-containing protein [Actinoallomurus sp. NPDC050550]|uniref:DUF397 domain-containing protein n=1 Tax=Actinoallomurus sp. NPDC050550 TaxID=3154937 RepID=UPI0034076231
MLIPQKDLSHLSWRKSTRSGGGQATCVEVAPLFIASSSQIGECAEVTVAER